MIYRKLKCAWSHNNARYIPNFTKIFPELSRISNEELCDRLIKLNLDFYYEEKTPVNVWMTTGDQTKLFAEQSTFQFHN